MGNWCISVEVNFRNEHVNVNIFFLIIHQVFHLFFFFPKPLNTDYVNTLRTIKTITASLISSIDPSVRYLSSSLLKSVCFSVSEAASHRPVHHRKLLLLPPCHRAAVLSGMAEHSGLFLSLRWGAACPTPWYAAT